MEKPEYVDEKGDTLYGYSQVSLDNNTFWTKAVVVVLSLILVYIVWITYYVISRNVINNIVATCGRCLG